MAENDNPNVDPNPSPNPGVDPPPDGGQPGGDALKPSGDGGDKGTGTILDGDKGGEGDDKGVQAVANWPDDWRQKLAGDDKDGLKTLERFTDPTSFWKSYQAMRQKVSSGELKAALGKDATPEQVAEWRKANGIPEKADGYELRLTDGLVIGEHDRPLVDQYLDIAHKLNHTPDQVNANVSWYFEAVRQQEQALAEANLEARSSTEEELRAEWGGEYRSNLNGIASMLDGAPDGVKEAIYSAKNVDGTNLLNRPGVMRWLAQMSRELNPVPTIAGVTGANSQGIDDEIAQIEGVMKSDRAKYNADEKMQDRLRKLYAARERLAGKAA